MNLFSGRIRRLLRGALLFVCGAVLFVGCDELLTETPENFVSSANFFQNQEQARAALNGVYKSLHRQLGQANVTVFEQPALPVTTRDDRGTPEGAANLWSWGAGHRGTRAVWPHLYGGINTANTFLANIQDVPGMSDQLKTQFAAEARFIRAWHHFELLHLFGNIPLKQEPTTEPTSEVPQASPSSVYEFLVNELDEIQNQLPPITEYSGSQKARINRSAAKVLLAKVYLQRASGHPPGVSAGSNDLSNAESLLREVIQTGNYELEDYEALFLDPATNDRNSEAIFGAEHTQIGGQGTAVENFIAPRNSDWGIGQWTTHHSNFDFLLSYNNGDVREDVAWLTEYVDANGETRKYDPFDTEGDTFQEDGASLRKLIYEGSPTLGWTEGWRDWMYFRYADVLLMLAESINRQGGPTPEAYDLVNEVRDRADAPDLETGLSQAEFSDSLYQERLWEFNQEFHGWRDCQRFFERCKQLVEESSQRAVQEDGPGNLRRYNAGSRPIQIETPKHRLWAIPSNAMERNAALDQNPGY